MDDKNMPAYNKSKYDYHKRVFKAYTFRFHKVNDLDIINALESKENKNGYIRSLIKNDIIRKKGENKMKKYSLEINFDNKKVYVEGSNKGELLNLIEEKIDDCYVEKLTNGVYDWIVANHPDEFGVLEKEYENSNLTDEEHDGKYIDLLEKFEDEMCFEDKLDAWNSVADVTFKEGIVKYDVDVIKYEGNIEDKNGKMLDTVLTKSFDDLNEVKVFYKKIDHDYLDNYGFNNCYYEVSVSTESEGTILVKLIGANETIIEEED